MSSSSKTDLNKYQKKSDKQHILDNPDTYIGSVEQVESNEFIFSENSISKKQILYNPGLYKLFDEGIVNCRDHVVRMQQAIKNNEDDCIPVSYIDISIGDTGTITMINDGNGIDIAEHPEYKIWIPELIFGHLRTSTNYNKEEKKIVGGKNGFGFKLVLIWSTWGKIETVDHKRGLKYVQEFHNNLDNIDKPKITKCKNKPYTKIEFTPDYKRLGFENGLTLDIVNLFKRRIYDIAAVTDKSIKVKLNSQVIPTKNFQQYVKLVVGDNEVKYEESNERWEYAVSLSPEGEFYQLSFVNGIYTSKGGKHVEYIMNQILKKLVTYIKAKKKIDVKPSSIKEQLVLFLRCDIENPAFDSQTKDFMNTPISKFGSTCEVSDKLIEKIAKMGVMNTACQITEVKETKTLKKQDGSKTKSIRGIPKLIDANFAGTAKSGQCTLILCEGDSAKAGIVSGLSRDDRNTIGVYPMKGKLLNVRGEPLSKIGGNKEITEIILFMTDQDLDGSHIKGLGLNLFESLWNSLVKIPDFIGYMNTPILKAKKGNQVKEFYNEGEFNEWKKTNDPKNWTIKYYKGLGTSTSKEFKEYFQHKKIVSFSSTGDSSSSKIDMIFNKKRSDDRKEWLSTYNRNSFIDTSKSQVTYETFIDKEFIHFSTYDNERSIPNLIDGLKISLRKIVYSAFKKRLTSEIKVAQFSGYVSEHSGYHHGESSLHSSIIGLAQNFVGSNNINLLEPKGQFGCIDPETPVLLWNGNIEKAKNIKVGDKLIGDDGTSRIVSKLTSGIDEMYEIKNGNMDNYIVNSHHILTVYYSGHKSIIWKKSSSSWSMSYFDDTTKSVKYKNIRTLDSANSNHYNKSSLSREDAYIKMLEFSKNIPDENIFDINVQQYLSLSKSVQQKIKGLINTNVIKWQHQDLEIDPYILGSWLGDGMSDCHAFASMDFEIIQYWALWLDTIGCELCHIKNIPPHENHTFYIRRRGSCKDSDNLAIGDISNSSNICKGCNTSKYNCQACDWSFEKSTNNVNCFGKNINGHNSRNLNPFKELFKKYKLFKNKHVPSKYVINSESNRLKILAGIIDTDGTLRKQSNSYRYEISQYEERKHLLESFRIIAGSLGFRAKIYKSKYIYTLSISGDNINKIPVKVPRKQIINQKRITNHHKVHNIEVTSIGQGSFCGWNIDKNERFLLGDFTITHNTRLLGGKDAASERYIFTHLSPLTRLIYKAEDDAILDYLEDDGDQVEPIYYVPIIPMILVNGSKGIGTGFSTDIMCYNPLQIIKKLKLMLKNKNHDIEIEPYYKGFKGTIELIAPKKYLIKGLYKKISDNKIEITELPIGTWTQDYKEYLETLIDNKSKDTKAIVKDYDDLSTESDVNFLVEFYPGVLKNLIQNVKDISGNCTEKVTELEKLLKLCTTHSINNMHLFDHNEHLQKYDSASDIVEAYYPIRYEYYVTRKENQLDVLKRELTILSNRARFILETLDNKIDLRKKSDEVIIQLLTDMKFDKNPDDSKHPYHYLTKMPMDSVSTENVEKILKDKNNKEHQFKELEKKTIETIWLDELEELETEYIKYNNKPNNKK
jgi:DNA gyrase/topoisomerase IV subunit B